MNKRIVVIEPPFFRIDTIKQIAAVEGDNVWFISNEARHEGLNGFFKCDVRSELDKASCFIRSQVEKPDAIVTFSEMFLTQTEKLADEFGVCRNGCNSVEISRNKSKMKKAWKDKNVLTPASQFYSSLKDMEGTIEFEFPVIIKPTLGYASCGVKKVNSFAELKEQIKKIVILNSTVIAREHLQGIGVLVEEYIAGEEYSVDTLWFDGEPICSGILSRGNQEGPYFPDRLYFADPQLDKAVESALLTASYEAVKAIGIAYGATHTEIRVKDGKPYVIESTSRPGAGGAFYYIFEKAYGIDFELIYHYITTCKTREEFDVCMKKLEKKEKSPDYYFFYNIPYEKEGIIDSIEGFDELCKQEGVIKAVCFKRPGSILYMEDMNTDYFLWILGTKASSDNTDIFSFAKKYDNMIRINFK
jgi:D-alanine-D-alanine ligase-like ATP-grasp enzyme